MKNKLSRCFVVVIMLFISIGFCFTVRNFDCALADTSKKFYTVYGDDKKTEVLFFKGEDISVGDMYLSHDNKLYEITSIDEKTKSGVAKFVRDEKLPDFDISPKKSNVASAAGVEKAFAKSNKKVGVYHTHNDESYYTPDGVDSVYGKGGIHDVGKALVNNLQKLGIEVVYREDLHLPHNSGAYTRSQVTASALLNSGVQAIFDIHRDSTSRKYYLANVNGEEMSAVRMVVGSSSANYEENKNFAYTIKAYADKVYPNFIKDIYIGKGNYNQQLSTNAMLFEMGCENIEKELAIKSTENLAKIIDVVVFGSDNASKEALNDVSLTNADGDNTVIEGVANRSANTDVNSNETLFVVLGMLGVVALIFTLVMIFSKEARYRVGRFFSEMFAGIFGKKKAK